jgi:hypothetical protein
MNTGTGLGIYYYCFIVSSLDNFFYYSWNIFPFHFFLGSILFILGSIWTEQAHINMTNSPVAGC